MQTIRREIMSAGGAAVALKLESPALRQFQIDVTGTHVSRCWCVDRMASLIAFCKHGREVVYLRSMSVDKPARLADCENEPRVEVREGCECPLFGGPERFSVKILI
jgi:hypothetical protein